MSTPKQKLYQAVIVSELLEKPLRSGDLWKAVRSRVRSKEQFMNNIHILIKAGVIERLKKSHKHVSYRVSAQPSEIVSFARRIRSGSTELLWDVINYLAHSNIFEGQEEAVEAAIDFWTVRYRNTCVLTALFSLAEPIDSGEGGKRSSPLKIREFYRTIEDRFFETILRLRSEYPEHFRSVLKRKLFLKGIQLSPSWLSIKLSGFLKEYYPQAYEKLGRTGESRILFKLLAKEREKEFFICVKHHQELPRGICHLCEYGPPPCKYAPSLRQEILARREKWGMQEEDGI